MSISCVSKIIHFWLKSPLLYFKMRISTHSQLLSLSPLAGAQEDVAAEHKAEASADWSEQEGHL